MNLIVNGTSKEIAEDPNRPLLEILREEFGLTGTKYGCGEGMCGACTVLVEGKRVFSCVTATASVAGKRITTIEGLAKEGGLHPVQEAFLKEGAVQCGYCTPGMIMSTVALLEAKPKPSQLEIVKWLHGNLCRCCGYPKIVRAVQRASGTFQ
jgi:carbon-monoxide dehydrogenase small subunit